MIIEVLSKIYRTGCNRGITKFEHPQLLSKLNQIIEWEFCKFPLMPDEGNSTIDADGKKVTPMVEDRDHLGKDPKLKPGNVFIYRGQVISIDSENAIVLSMTESGYNALERIWTSDILPELTMLERKGEESCTVDWCQMGIEKLPTNYVPYNVSYDSYRIWKDHFIEGRIDTDKKLCIKVCMESEDCLLPINLYMLDWKIYYDPEEVCDDELKYLVPELLEWFFSKYPRVEQNARERNRHVNEQPVII